jgi:hypothetical protein
MYFIQKAANEILRNEFDSVWKFIAVGCFMICPTVTVFYLQNR